jgi:hypothetical protein
LVKTFKGEVDEHKILLVDQLEFNQVNSFGSFPVKRLNLRSRS